jgi:hypothetical protein
MEAEIFIEDLIPMNKATKRRIHQKMLILLNVILGFVGFTRFSQAILITYEIDDGLHNPLCYYEQIVRDVVECPHSETSSSSRCNSKKEMLSKFTFTVRTDFHGVR